MLLALVFLCLSIACPGGGGGGSAPASPTDLVATATSSATIDLSWNDNASDESNYALQRSMTSGHGYSDLATLAADSTSYTDDTTASATTYFYRVYASNNEGNSDYSNEASATTEARITGSIPFNTGKTWLYDLNWSVTCVGCGGVTVETFEGESILYVAGQMAYEGRSAWQVLRYDIETTPSTDNAFRVRTKYLFQDSSGLQSWEGNRGWRRVLSTQMSSFDNNSLLMTRSPNSGAHTEQTVVSVTVPSGTYNALRANSTYREGFSSYAPVDHNEDHSEYYVDNVGLVKSVWDFWYDDNDPGAIDVYEVGTADLKAMDGDVVWEIEVEQEPNDCPDVSHLVATAYSIVNGAADINDSGCLISDGNVAENTNGQAKAEDWYRFEIAEISSFRLDFVYEYFTNGQFNDLDVYLYREATDDSYTFVDRSVNDGTGDTPQESILQTSLPPGTYYVAVQAWNTPTGSVDYWFLAAVHGIDRQ